MSRLLGQSMGIAAVAVIFDVTAKGGVTLHSIRLALICGACFTALAGLVTSFRLSEVHLD